MSLSFGTTYPTMDLGTEPAVLAAWARGLEEIGFDEIYLPEHVVGINVQERPDWEPLNPNTLQTGKPLYDHRTPFLEPCVAMGFLAGVTERITLTSGIMVAPQRQTVLIAKQMAIADVLSKGRVRLGVGVGWNDAEFEALGASFKQRGKRMDQQIELLRRLWTEESVTYRGDFDAVTAAGICPLPVQRPIPIITGGDSEPALERAARTADGWFITSDVSKAGDRVRRYWERVDELGRRDAPSLTGTIYLAARQPEELVEDVERWARLGATHLNIRTSTYPVQLVGGEIVRKADVDTHLSALDTIRTTWLGRRAA
ncbi:LLM class F420-dependent oxidoreductase [Dactylosporangium sp. NPDC051484]|uniref:LLM class F420-dependent oxidoreductase n=1 Tax=Dactylosporangium sp. NPDC051484 TaxID=3154942 RepID=UPI00344CA7FE